MAVTGNREFDIVVFGATGYTGEYVVEELARAVKGTNKKWAVAGRNERKLKASLEKVQKYMDEDIDITGIPVIEADVSDKSSIEAMCSRTKLVLNCVGPYKLYGEVVVAACVKIGTHHVDLSGEMQYLETMQAKYFDDAMEKEIYIVQACGFDSIPSDYGIAVLKKKFQGDLNSVEVYAKVNPGPEGYVTNTGTWMSAVNSVSDKAKWWIKNDVKKIFTKKLPFSTFKLPFRLPVFYNNEVQSWCVVFPGPDVRVIERSQMFCYQFLDERPVHVKEYIQLSSLLKLFYGIFFGFAILLSLCSWGRKLLEKFPSFFSAGLFSVGGPKREQVMSTSTTFTLLAKGWPMKLIESSDQHDIAPTKKVKLVIRGPEPAYALTSRCMVHSGLTILDENDKLPLTGGVLTPGAAFKNTTLQERLEKHGIKFEYVE